MTAMTEMASWQRTRSRLYLRLARLRRGMTLGVRIMVVDGDRVLLVRHTYVPGWQFPGGGVEANETAEEAGIRETFEETGHRIAGPLELLGFYFNGAVHPRDHIALYRARAFEAARPFRSNWEIAEIDWFRVGDLPVETSSATRRRIAEAFEGVPPATRW
jgi:8-oxo-dGTP pyrophosphatase MutT (NUDIX family)